MVRSGKNDAQRTAAWGLSLGPKARRAHFVFSNACQPCLSLLEPNKQHREFIAKISDCDILQTSLVFPKKKYKSDFGNQFTVSFIVLLYYKRDTKQSIEKRNFTYVR